MSSIHISRRSFLQASAASILTAASWSRVYGANDRLRVAAVGCGGKGRSDINGVAASPHVDYVALCDILHFPLTSHGQAANSSSRSASAFNWAVWSGPHAAA